MNLVKEIFARIWALWALLFFISTMFIAYLFYIPCHFLKEPGRAKWHRNVSRVWMFIYLHAIGCPLKIKGAKNFKNVSNCIIVCNHNSLMDVPVTTPFMPRANKTIAKKSFSYFPVFGWIYSFGSVLVDRKSEASRRESFNSMKSVLAMGMHMCIYPEGTRNRTNDPLKSFHDGAFRLALATGKPLMPALIFNSRKVMPEKPAFSLFPHRMKMHFLPPVHVSSTDTVDGLKQKLFAMMSEYYERTERGFS